MFDFLKNYKVQSVAPAVHHSIQLIRQWAYATSLDDRLALRGDDSLSPEQINLIREIVAEIEYREQASLKDLDPKQKKPYIIELTNISQSLSNDQYRANKDKGKLLLEQLRRLDSHK